MPLDFSRMHNAFFGAFGVTVTRSADATTFVGVLLKRNSETVAGVGMTQTVETWHLLARPADANLAEYARITVPDGRTFQVQSHRINADGIWEYALNKVS